MENAGDQQQQAAKRVEGAEREDTGAEAAAAPALVDVDSRSEREPCCVLKGVTQLSDSGVTRLPERYVLPASDRPGTEGGGGGGLSSCVKLPVVDLARLRDPSERAAALETVDAACRDYGFFQVVNHGVDREVIGGMLDVARRFFEVPLAERERYMSPDVRAAVRHGTSFNQAKDAVLFWRDFLKLACQPLRDVVTSWPDAPTDLREVASRYAVASHGLFMELMEAALGALGIPAGAGARMLGELAAGHSQIMMANCYPACPQPELTLGLPPHSDYGLLTLLLQEVEGLQVMHNGRWLTVDPVPGSFIVNVGDQFEIYSNGQYKSVLHRVLVNSARARFSVASFHCLPLERTIGPAAELVNERNPRRYMDTSFATFLAHLSKGEHRTFLQSRKLTHLIGS